MCKFRGKRSVKNPKRVVGNQIAMERAVLGDVNLDPTISTRQSETVSGIRRPSIRILTPSWEHLPLRQIQFLFYSLGAPFLT